MITRKNYYSVLDISDKASPEDVGKAYRKLALKYHPDITHEDESGSFREITEAYEILKDPEKRKNYDRSIIRIPKTSRIRRGTDIQISLKINADDIAQERTKNIITTRKSPCPSCIGTGSSSKKMTICASCHGSGIDVVSSVMGPKKFCLSCHGFGNYPISNDCKKCAGTGLITEQISRQISISRQDFTTNLVIPGSGNYPPECGIGGIFGNLLVSFIVEKSSSFEIEGKNVKGIYRISPAQAVLGDIVFVDIFGELVKIEIPSGTHPGEILEKDKALKIKDKTKNLCLKIYVDIPKQPSEEEKSLYTHLLKLQKGYL